MSALASATGALLAAGAVALHAALLGRVHRVDGAAGEPPWWSGYARDGANLAAAALLFSAFVLAGYAAPIALLSAVVVALGAYLGDGLSALLGGRATGWRSGALALGPIAIALALAAHRVGPALSRLLAGVLPP